MADFVDIPFQYDEAALADLAIEGLRGTWEDWEPNDADPEVVVIEEVSPMAAALASVAARIPAEAFRVLGTKVFGVPYLSGAPATTTVTLTLVDGAGYTVEAGRQLNIDGFAFALVSDAVAAPGTTEIAGVEVMATGDGADRNNLAGAIVASLTLPPYVTAISVDAPTANGVDDEDDGEYLDRVAREVTLRAKTLVTAVDFAIEAMNNLDVARAFVTQDATRHLAVTLVGPDGGATSAGTKAEVEADYDTLAMQNLTWAIGDPEFNTVDVDVTVRADPSAAPASVIAWVTAVLQSRLNPLVWGQPSPTSTALSVPGWENTPTVSKNALIGAITGGSSSAANGVRDVVSLTLSSPTAGAVVGADGDLTMAGSVPLPEYGTINVTVVYS